MKRMVRIFPLVFGSILSWSMASAADVYVESSGSCGGKTPCYSTIQKAINAASSEVTIKVALGDYNEEVTLNTSKNVLLQSGWNSTFTAKLSNSQIKSLTISSGKMSVENIVLSEKSTGLIYYVSTRGNDQLDGLTEVTAFATLGHAIKIVRPGESIHILSGTYHEALMLENIGSSEAAITIRGLGTKPVFDGQRSATIGFWCEKCKNLLFDNLEFTNYSDIGIGVYLSTGITMQDLKIHNNGFAPQLKGWEIEGYGIDVDTSDLTTIKNNQVYCNGPDPKPFGILGTGINTFKCTDCVIQNNYSYENIGGGILVEDGVNVLVEGNEVRANYLDATEDEWWDGGLWVDGGHNIVVRNNLFATNIGPGIEISDEDLQKPYGYVLENNICTENYYGIFIWNLSKDDTWPDESILSRSGNQFIQNSIKDVWIVESY
jgi:polygalacturonase